MTSLLTIENLSINFNTDAGVLYAVKQLNLSIQAGEAIAVVGESGAGKSQIFQAVMGLLSRNAQVEGHITFKQHSLLQQSEQQLNKLRGSQMAMIFQDPMTTLNPYLKIGIQLTEILMLHQKMSKSAAKIKAIDMLKKMELPHPEQCFNTYPHLLSGGMRQRVVIAIALLCEPELLIADEPTTALDVTLQARIMALLKQFYVQSKMAIVLITHDLPLALNFCERIAVMYAGRIVEIGTTTDILYHPQYPYTQALLAAAPQNKLNAQGRLHTIQGTLADPLQPPNAYCAFKNRCAYIATGCEQALNPYPINTQDGQHQHQVACFYPLRTTR